MEARRTADCGSAESALFGFVSACEAGLEPEPELFARRCESLADRDEFYRLLGEYRTTESVLNDIEGSPQEIGPYQVQGMLGRGGMGTVFEVWDRDLNRTLAMKVGREGIGFDPDGTLLPGGERSTARFLQEAQIESQLRHPGVVPVHELGVDPEGRLYFTMQIVEEATFEEVLRQHEEGQADWPRTRLVGVLLKVCETMTYAHSQGVIHRDLKPENVMVGRYGEVYVMDWGLAKVLDRRGVAIPIASEGQRAALAEVVADLSEEYGSCDAGFTHHGSVLGTPSYMAPEQASGDPDAVGPHSDVYSVGAMLYRLLSGRAPYSGEEEHVSPKEMLGLLGAGPPTPLADGTGGAAELRAICSKAMARDPKHRYEDMEALRVDLQSLLDGRVVSAYESGVWAATKKWILRNRLASAAAVLMFAGGITVAAVNLIDARERFLDEDSLRLESLQRSVEELWPVRSGTVPGMDEWLGVARDVLGRRETHERRGKSPAIEAGLSRLPALVAAMEERRRDASTILERTVEAPGIATRWAEAANAVRAMPRYRGLELMPQVGLVPLGPDPVSGLWEFGDVQTGIPPERDPDTGLLAIDEEMGIVFVLLPPGSFQRDHRDDAKDPLEGNQELITISSPFFMAKHEMTQAQWSRIMGFNPSLYGPGSGTPELQTTALHPVEHVSWLECNEAMDRLGFELPSEDEWEYAARANTTTPWWTGDTKVSLEGKVNLCDGSVRRAGLPNPAWDRWPHADDGYPWHAPVDFGAANPFGLYNVTGNVFEWCSSAYEFDSQVRVPGPPSRVVRGGSFANSTWYLRASYNIGRTQRHVQASLGLRPARRISPLP